MSEEQNVSPFNAVPPVVVALAVFILGIECVFYLGSEGFVGGPTAVGWRLATFQQYAFSSEIFFWMAETGRWTPEHLLRFVSYLFLHGNFIHAAFAAVMVLALGNMVGEVFSGFATLVVFVVPGIVGALVYAFVWPSSVTLIGAYPGVYGFIGAFSFLLWVRLRSTGDNQMRAFALIGGLMFIQLVFGLLFGGTGDWIADVAGFATGFGLSFFLVPGGWARIREMIRRG
ncbi:rhomboid family intramembrane serine protease [Cognatishimia activa]|uniref:Rhomboid family intramembrane serine protease n=1 Tax=Cognatishimia activa TaxID=1715691 RepID=A0A975EQS8_9RHOB|nr:rhomboid family intramembrane serine protease [Cognatishimia activa]QTN36601.1 rhomboid family intramembrane serine protease [Cognatishimia activa]